MAIHIEWDPEKAALNVTKHGVSFEQAKEVLRDPVSRNMKKADDPGSRFGPLPVYDLKGGVRGKYANRLPETSRESPALRYVWAPLSDFPRDGSEYRIAPDTWICPASAYRGYDAPDFDEVLAPEDRALCRDVQHWLLLKLPAHYALSAGECINSFLLALWIVKPTRTHVELRFHESAADVPSVYRVRDRFQWIHGQVTDKLQDEDLVVVSDFLPRIRAAYVDRGRLRNALVLTSRGCVSGDWQSAFTCWSAAAEAMLTYERGPELTASLARAYARLVESEVPTADAINQFETMSDIRSTIVHGRSYDRDGNAKNPDDLAACSDMLRRMWRAALRSEETRCMLESDDDVRKRFFEGS